MKTYRIDLGKSVVDIPLSPIQCETSTIKSISTFDVNNRNEDTPEELSTFLQLAKGKKRFMDIGAQHGLFSLAYLSQNPDGQAFSFEGGFNPYLGALQNKILNKSDNWHLFNMMIGDVDKLVKVCSEEKQTLALPEEEGNENRMMFSIDTANKLFDIRPDIIKMDIEGCEIRAFKGMKQTINDHQPIMCMEIHPKLVQRYGGTIDQILEFQKSIEYDVYDISLGLIENYEYILRSEQKDSHRSVWLNKHYRKLWK